MLKKPGTRPKINNKTIGNKFKIKMLIKGLIKLLRFIATNEGIKLFAFKVFFFFLFKFSLSELHNAAPANRILNLP